MTSTVQLRDKTTGELFTRTADHGETPDGGMFIASESAFGEVIRFCDRGRVWHYGEGFIGADGRHFPSGWCTTSLSGGYHNYELAP